MTHAYEAARYRGKTWGIFHKPTRNWMIFGSRKAMTSRAATLNLEG